MHTAPGKEGVPMNLRMLAAASAVVAGVFTSTAGAALSPTYSVVGTEIAFTATQGVFVGVAFGSTGDNALWKAVVDHTPLSPSATITGGTLALESRDHAGEVTSLTASFTGGTVTLTEPGLPCANQRYDVIGTLGNVTTATSAGGSGLFAAVLTHYRAVIFGACRTYAASVVGNVAFGP
jgi:hypothetical protein